MGNSCTLHESHNIIPLFYEMFNDMFKMLLFLEDEIFFQCRTTLTERDDLFLSKEMLIG